MSRRSSFAFTLIELLTVIAITAILLTIIVVPVVQSFNLTRMAQAFVDAQDRGRTMSARISREIANAALVRDLSAFVTTTVNGATEEVPASTLIVDVPQVNPDGSIMQNAPTVQALLPYAKIDLMEPAQGQIIAPGQYLDPRSGFIDPTLQGPRGQINLPVGIGSTMIRYWIGLHNPTVAPTNSGTVQFNPYNDPYSDLIMNYSGTQDNLYVLYRAEVQPYVWRAPANNAGGASAYRPNLAYFQADATDTQIVDEDDPNFFNFIPGVDLAADGITLTASGQAKATRISNWKKVATLQTEISRYDLVFPVYDKASRKVQNVNGVPELISLAQFRPTRITAETIAGETASRLGEESASGAAVSPDVFMSQYAMWSNPVVRSYPIGWQPGASTGNSAIYEVGRNDLTLQANTIFAYPQQSGTTGLTGVDDQSGGTPLFGVDIYNNVVASGGLYPFSQAITPYINNLTPNLRQSFIPFNWNTKSGKIITSFGINEVGNPTVPPGAGNPNNLPTLYTTPNAGAGTAYTPSTDPNNLATGVFSDPEYASIDEYYNKIWNDYPQLHGLIHRFMDLRVIPNADGTPSPLYPDYIAGQVTGLGHLTDLSGNSLYSRVSIVPGTEQVIGPDQNPGPNYGAAIRYTRVTQNPGPDQYVLNYTDIPQPTDADGVTVDYSVAFPGFANPQTAYTATDFSTAVLQPRYKAGYLQLCSDPNVPLPPGNIQVSYRFQVSGKLTGALASTLTAQQLATVDSFSVDYDSRQLMDVLITVRNYPQTTLNPNPQTVTLKSTAAVRNYQR